MKTEIPKFDLPVDYIIMSNITGKLVNQYGRFPCKIKAGLFILCTKGTIQATINLSEYTVKANDFITLLPGSFIQIHNVSSDIKLYVAGFSSKFISIFNPMNFTQNLLLTILENPVLPIPPANTSVFENIYKAFIDAYPLQDLLRNKEMIKAISFLFTQGACELYQSQSSWESIPITRENNIYKRFLLFVLKKYKEEHDVTYYAKCMGLTLPYFCNCIKKASGHTPSDIIAATIVMDAKTQLRTTEFSIKEIANSLGFGNSAFFSKYFKRHTGSTPQEYKRS